LSTGRIPRPALTIKTLGCGLPFGSRSTLRILEKADLDREIDVFLIDRRARALSPRTIDYYDEKLTLFRTYLQGEGIRVVGSITAPIVRRFITGTHLFSHSMNSSHLPWGMLWIARSTTAIVSAPFL